MLIQFKRYILCGSLALSLMGCEVGVLANLTTNSAAKNETVPPTFSGILTAVANSSGQPVLTWNAATGSITTASQMGYIVYRSTNQFAVLTSAYQTVTGVTTYVDTSVTLGQTYWYAVRAINLAGLTDGNSVVKSVQTISPVTFAGLKSARAISDTRVELDYDAATGGSGTIYYDFYQNFNFSASIGSSATKQFIVQNLNPGSNYTFIARAVDSVNGEFPNTVSRQVTTFQCCYPVFNGIASLSDAPGIAGQTQLIATWNAATPPAGRTIAGYNVYTSLTSGGQNFGAAPQYQTLLTTFNLTGLLNNFQYYVVVRAVDSAGYEEKNAIEMVASTAAVQPISFGGLASASQGTGSAGFNTVILNWLPGTGSFDQYQVFMASSQGAENFGAPVQTLGSSATSTTLTAANGITGNHAFYFVVRAINSSTLVTDGNFIEKSTTTTPNPPAFLGITSAALPAGVGALNTVTASWNPAAGVFNNYRIFARWPTRAAPQNAYDFSLNAGHTDFANYYSSAGSTFTSQSITPLIQNELVCFAVRAVWVDGINFLQDTQDINNITEQCATPTLSPPSFGGITQLTLNAAANMSSVIASWNPASGVFDSYEIFVGASPTTVKAIANNAATPCDTGINPCRITQQSTTDGTTPLTTSTITGLPPGTNIYVIVQALYSVSNTVDGNNSYIYVTTASLNAHLAWTTKPSAGLPGSSMPQQPVVCLYDASNNLLTSITTTVTLSISAGGANGSLATGTGKTTVTLNNGCATYSSAKLIDANMSAPLPVTIIASAPGVTAAPGVTIQNAIGACLANSASVYTANGGCYDQTSGLTFSTFHYSASTLWSDVVACNTGECDGAVGAYPDTTPATGLCHSLTEGGYTDWRVPTIGELNATLNIRLTPGANLNYGGLNPSNQGFGSTDDAVVWSATSNASNPAYAEAFYNMPGAVYGEYPVVKSATQTDIANSFGWSGPQVSHIYFGAWCVR